jgi:hypothetical protein
MRSVDLLIERVAEPRSCGAYGYVLKKLGAAGEAASVFKSGADINKIRERSRRA